MSMFDWIKGKGKKMEPKKEIDAIIKDIRNELRKEHKRITVLFKDLDDFIAQLPEYLSK